MELLRRLEIQRNLVDSSWIRQTSRDNSRTFDYIAVAPVGRRVDLSLDQLRAWPEGQGLDSDDGRHHFDARQLGERLVVAAKTGVVGADENVGTMGGIEEALVGCVSASGSGGRGQHDSACEGHDAGQHYPAPPTSAELAPQNPEEGSHTCPFFGVRDPLARICLAIGSAYEWHLNIDRWVAPFGRVWRASGAGWLVHPRGAEITSSWSASAKHTRIRGATKALDRRMSDVSGRTRGDSVMVRSLRSAARRSASVGKMCMQSHALDPMAPRARDTPLQY